MEKLYSQVLTYMKNTVYSFAQRIPAPQRIPYRDSFVYRYVEKTIHQALVQKLARLVSTLHASYILMESGFVQEQAALQRVLDEIQEDITFLSYGVIFNDVTELHKEYVQYFYEEEFDADTALESTQKRSMVKRKKIWAYIARIEAAGNPSSEVEVCRTLSKCYSGFVHAASSHIMDMYGGDPPRFHMHGMAETERQAEHLADIWNYFYRGIIAFSVVAKAFGDDDLFQKIFDFARSIEHTGGEYSPDRIKKS